MSAARAFGRAEESFRARAQVRGWRSPIWVVLPMWGRYSVRSLAMCNVVSR
jgi:hypothetical protein